MGSTSVARRVATVILLLGAVFLLMCVLDPLWGHWFYSGPGQYHAMSLREFMEEELRGVWIECGDAPVVMMQFSPERNALVCRMHDGQFVLCAIEINEYHLASVLMEVTGNLRGMHGRAFALLNLESGSLELEMLDGSLALAEKTPFRRVQEGEIIDQEAVGLFRTLAIPLRGGRFCAKPPEGGLKR